MAAEGIKDHHQSCPCGEYADLDSMQDRGVVIGMDTSPLDSKVRVLRVRKRIDGSDTARSLSRRPVQSLFAA